jgi:hypothetical protein
MNTRRHQQGTETHSWRHAVAAMVVLVLSIIAVPAAHAEPMEGDKPGTSTAEIESDRTVTADTNWPQPQLEALEDRQEGAGDNSLYQAQQDAYLRFLEHKANAATGGEPAVVTSTEDSGPPWLVGVGVVAIVAIASIVAAILRSRRPEAVTEADRDTVHV